LIVVVALMLGCGERQPQAADTTPYMTEQQWRELPPEEQHDPYILRRLQTQPRP